MREDPEFASHAAAELSPHIRSFIGVPVVLSDDAFYGTLCAVDPEPQKTLTRQQADLMAVLARLVATQIERQQAEEALRESEERYRAFFETAAVGAAEADLVTGRLLQVNDKLCRLLGYGREELLTKTFSQITHPSDRARDSEGVARLLRGEIREYVAEKRGTSGRAEGSCGASLPLPWCGAKTGGPCTPWRSCRT